MQAADFRAYCRRLDFSSDAIAAIERVRSCPPSRTPESRQSNVPVWYPSRKMGCTIKAESYKVEFAFLQEAEYSDEVLEYYDQPPAIRLEYPSRTGRIQRPWHTADYFVLRQDGAGWEECKPERELQRLTHEQPHRYVLDEDTCWRCPPGEIYAAALGLTYRVRSSGQIAWAAQANWLYLEDYYRHAKDLFVADAVRAALLAAVDAQPGISLADLRAVAPQATADDLHALIVCGDLYVDLNAHRVAEADRTPIYRSQRIARAYASSISGAGVPASLSLSERRDDPVTTSLFQALPLTLPGPSRAIDLAPGGHFLWDSVPWRIVNVGEHDLTLLPLTSEPVDQGRAHRVSRASYVAHATDVLTIPRPAFETLVGQGKIVGSAPQGTAPRTQGTQSGLTDTGRDLLACAGEKALAEATRRAQLLEYSRRRDRLAPEEAQALARVPQRTIRHWNGLWRQGEVAYGSGYVGLLPQYRRCGRGAQVPYEIVTLLEAVLEAYYDTATNRLKRGAYGEFLLRCAEAHLPATSERTFYTYAAHHLPAHEQALRRSGPRGAYRYKDHYQEEPRTFARHGDHAWAVAHIDHTELDLELVASDTGKRLGKAWLTLLVSASTRKILAYVLSFDRPSATSCMLVLRECVRRHHRLPQTIVVDGGAEFRSVYFETLLARYEVTKRQRPPHEPRYGAVLERLFGTANTQFVYHLLGNTQLTHRKRQVTLSTDPKTYACWTLPTLAARLEEWAYTVYDTIEHPALERSPRDAHMQSLEIHGARSHRLIPYDLDFLLATYATTRTGIARVQVGRGVQINYVLYWCDAMRDPTVEGQSVPVRYDPLDVTVAYAYVRGIWRRCITAYAAEFAVCSERELALLTEEVRQRRRLTHGRTAIEITQKQLADFRRANTQVERVLLQRQRDRELRTTIGANSEDRNVYHETQDGSDFLSSLESRMAAMPSEDGDLTADMSSHPRGAPAAAGNETTSTRNGVQRTAEEEPLREFGRYLV